MNKVGDSFKEFEIPIILAKYLNNNLEGFELIFKSAYLLFDLDESFYMELVRIAPTDWAYFLMFRLFYYSPSLISSFSIGQFLT